MKPTVYEITRDLMAPVLGQAHALLDESPDPAELMIHLFSNSRGPADVLAGSVMSALPLALSERAAAYLPDIYSWAQFSSAPEIITLARFEVALSKAFDFTAVQHQAEAWASATVLHLWQYQCHKKAGERVYEVSRGLGERLLNTELHGLSTEDLRLPYPNIYIVVPPELGLKIRNEQTGDHALEGVYVTETTSEEGLRHWRLMFWGPPNENAKSEHDDALFHFSVDLPEGKTLKEAFEISETWRAHADNPGTVTAKAFYLAEWRRMFSLVMNVVMYSTWPEAELREVANPEWATLQAQMKKHPKGSHKYERNRAKLRRTHQQRRVLLGASVERLDVPEHRKGSSPTVRTLVSGHWQNFRTGVGRVNKVLKWRSPFWRGPIDGATSNPRRVMVLDGSDPTT